MSDTTAFLTGCAMAGVATLLLFRGGQGVGQLSFPMQTQPGAPTVTTDPLGTTPAPSDPATVALNVDPQLRAYLEKQRVATEQLMTELEQQKTATEQLKLQLDQQNTETRQVLEQVQSQQVTPEALEQAKTFQTGMIWAVGGIVVVLVVVGSVLLVGLIAIAAQPKRTPRTTHVFHPMNLPTSQALPGRHPELASPRRTRYVQNIERDDY